MTATVDIILVSYNTADYTVRALSSVYKETQKYGFTITVVDNNSRDHSVTLIQKNFPNIRLIQSNQNLGFARAVNLAASYADAPYLLLLNPDTVVLEGAIDKLVEFAGKHPENKIWGGITLNKDLSINTHNAWAEESIKTLLFSLFGLNRLFKNSCFFNQANYGCWQRDTVKAVDILQGSFFLTERSLWQKLNGLDERFFMYAEEADYCYRARKLGCQPLITPQAKIIHHGGSSEKNLSGKMIRLLSGKVTFINKHHQQWKRIIMKVLLLLYVHNKWLITTLLALFRPAKKTLRNEWWKVLKASPIWLKGYQ